MQNFGYDSKYLKSRFLDGYRAQADSATLDAVAHMLFEIERKECIVDVALAFIARKLEADRVDIGFGNDKSQNYEANFEFKTSDAPSVLGVCWPNKDQIIQRIWVSSKPTGYYDVQNNPEVALIKNDLHAIGTRSMLTKSLSQQNRNFAIVCIDDLQSGRSWNSKEEEFVHYFCEDFLSPILDLSIKTNKENKAKKPTYSEIEAIRLAALGFSYKQVAYELGKSIRTIENQFRNARLKVGAKNQTDLIMKCQNWLV